MTRKRYELPRGLRNCNPGNIRRNPDVFQGERNPSSDPEFKQFKSMPYGYRAMFRTLSTYHRMYRLDTIEKMIGRWAPMNENNTEGYVSLVESYSGIPRDTPVDIHNQETMCAIVAAMSRVENGREADMNEVLTGWKLLQGGRL